MQTTCFETGKLALRCYKTERHLLVDKFWYKLDEQIHISGTSSLVYSFCVPEARARKENSMSSVVTSDREESGLQVGTLLS